MEITASFTSNYHLLHLGMFFLISRCRRAGPHQGIPSGCMFRLCGTPCPIRWHFNRVLGSIHLCDFKNVNNLHISPPLFFQKVLMTWIHSPEFIDFIHSIFITDLNIFPSFGTVNSPLNLHRFLIVKSL